MKLEESHIFKGSCEACAETFEVILKKDGSSHERIPDGWAIVSMTLRTHFKGEYHDHKHHNDFVFCGKCAKDKLPERPQKRTNLTSSEEAADNQRARRRMVDTFVQLEVPQHLWRRENYF